VERRDRLELADLLAHLAVDQDRLAEARAAVDDTVGDGLGLDVERLDGDRLAAVDEMELRAGRAGIDD
jgi:hypothetical protein